MTIAPDAFARLLEVFQSEYVLVMVLPYEAYFDETGTHSTAKFVCVAGYLFSQDSAREYARLWEVNVKPLLPPGALFFHAAECIGRYGKFKGISETRSQEIVDAMISVIMPTALYGVVIGVERNIYESEITREPIFKKYAGSPYTLCSARCLEYVADWMTKEKMDGHLTYFFEAGDDDEGELSRYLSAISNNDDLKARYRFNGYGFPNKMSAMQLQASDLLAWEWQRWYRTVAFKEPHREWRLTMSRLAEKPTHIAHIEDVNVGIRVLINMFYGIDFK